MVVALSGSKKGSALRRSAFGMLIAISIAAIVVGTWVYANRDSVRVSLFDPDAGDLLDRLIAGSRLPIDGAGPVERMRLDGTTPDAARRTVRVRAKPDLIADAVRRSCGMARLGPADPSTLGSEPDALCVGEWNGGEATVTLSTRCAASCEADIGVYVIP